MDFTMKELLEAIGPSASLIFASWIFLSFLQTRYTAAYDRYRSLVEERRKHLEQQMQHDDETDDRHQQSVGNQIELYRHRCEFMRLATNIGVVAAILLIVTILCGGLQVILPGAGVLKWAGAVTAFAGLILLIVAAAFVIVENVQIGHVMDDEKSDLPGLERERAAASRGQERGDGEGVPAT
jgi:hypothetical protein